MMQSAMDAPVALTVAGLRAAYANGDTTPAQVLGEIRERAEALHSHNIWITLLDLNTQQPWLDALADKDPATHPLWGIPFAIKDNIDLAGIPTTAGCEAFAYTPDAHATCVARLLDAGAIPVGKANLDQFATGLNGTRSPWGACANAVNPDYISGGSSSGSAVAVALGLAAFSLGTDTAGSGRVPAAFNGLVGLKPTRGLVPTSGVVPACRTLDCVSVFAHDTDDAHAVLTVMERCDAGDAFSRPNAPHNGHWQYASDRKGGVLGVIPQHQLRFFGDASYEAAWHQLLHRMGNAGITLVEVDFSPFLEAAALLYQGPWVTERYLVVQSLLEQKPEALLPVIRDIIGKGAQFSAAEVFSSGYRLQGLRQRCLEELDKVDALLTPTAGRLYTRDALLEEPIKHNNDLGYYTNFMNLVDLSAVAAPAGLTVDGLPFGVTLVADAFRDRHLLSMAKALQPILSGDQTAALPEQGIGDERYVEVLVCGAHLEGLPLNWQLRERGGELVRRTRTAPCYRFYALAGGPPYRPGLVHDSSAGAAIEVEIWRLPIAHFGSFVAGIPAPLGIGRVVLEDNSEVCGFICEPRALSGAEEITAQGSWRRYLDS